jgi:ribosomal protein L11 methylase PrmA
MNTAEPRWKVVAAKREDAAWELLVAESGPECVLELEASVEIYFARREQAETVARHWRLPAPELTAAGGGEVFGEHPTTELCLEMMQGVVRPGEWTADIGSGTGRLSAEALRQGARCVAADIDWPAAVASRRSGALTLQGSADALRGGAFDGVLANLHLAVWRAVAAEIGRIAAPSAWMVAGGLLEAQAEDVRSLLAPLGFRIRRTAKRQGWVGLLAQRSL